MKTMHAIALLTLLGGVLPVSAATPSKTPAPIAIHSVSVDLPASTASFPPGPGSDIAGKCLICHSAGMVLKQPLLTQAEWTAEINKMRTAYGAPIEDSEVATLSTYLTKVNADQQTK
ncbi:cytochrome c [Dyella telluris]|uniref:Cytochrome c n=1 Tax=Dyella telluris TaxID=2763498 RepID=A0A7G8Q7W9_9GAMM|nr:cytochrome c [Dyella telluris]QNK02877.1 cytochrome c [Dyella telluris]